MNIEVDLDSFLTLVPRSQIWEIYLQGRKAIHAEYGNVQSSDTGLRLTPVNKWGARITSFDREKRFVVEGDWEFEKQKLLGKSLRTSLSYTTSPPEKVYTVHEEIKPKIDPNTYLAERLWEMIFTQLEWIIQGLKRERYQIKVWSGWEFRAYYNSLGSRMVSVFPISKLKISVKISEGGLIKRAGAREGLEFFADLPRPLVRDFLQDVQNAKKVKKGESTSGVIILDPEAMAMFIHKAIGHSCEGDHVLEGNSYIPAVIGQQIAPPNVTIVDSPRDYSSLGSYPFDDEGAPAQTTHLIKEGIVREYLLDRNSGLNLGLDSTGNARSFWYDATPKVRMSNFVMLPGTEEFKSILSGTREGLLVKGMKSGGCEESTGDFHFKPNIAYRIRDGELREAVLIPEITGNALYYLNAITEISKESSLCVAGCGKPTPQSDYVWVGYGAPYVKF
jgi:predicted Zn-dependent protease